MARVACHSLVEHDDVMLLGVSAGQANGKVVGFRPSEISQHHSPKTFQLFKSTKYSDISNRTCYIIHVLFTYNKMYGFKRAKKDHET